MTQIKQLIQHNLVLSQWTIAFQIVLLSLHLNHTDDYTSLTHSSHLNLEISFGDTCLETISVTTCIFCHDYIWYDFAASETA